MSFSQQNSSFIGSKTARDIIVTGPQSSRRFNKSSSRQEPLSRKPSASAGRQHPSSKEKSTSFTNSSFLNSSQLDNQRSNSQNAHYVQESSLSNYIALAFDRERRATTSIGMHPNINFQGSMLLSNQLSLTLQRKENKSPLTSRPTSRFEEQPKNKILQEVQINKTKTAEEYRVREMKLLLRIAALEKESYRLVEQLQKFKLTPKKSNFLEQQEQVDNNMAKLQRDKNNLELQVLSLRENLEVQKAENAVLKKYVSSHTSATKRLDSKNISTRTNTIASVNSSSGYKQNKIVKEYLPSFMVALRLTC